MKQPHYLLVDDDPINNMINERMLKKHHGEDIVCQVFPDGKPAISHFKNGGAKPDMIFLDINMPEVDGWEFLEFYRHQNDKAPVVMLTSSIDPKDLEKSKRYDCILDFISKPLMPNAIEKLVKKIQANNE